MTFLVNWITNGEQFQRVIEAETSIDALLEIMEEGHVNAVTVKAVHE